MTSKTKLTVFNKQNANQMMDDFINHFKEFETAWGVKVEVRGGKFDLDVLRPKIEIRLLNSAAAEPTFENEAWCWSLDAESHGLRKEWLHAIISEGGRKFKVVGINPRRPKRCVALMDVESKKMAFANARWLINRLK